MHQSDLIPFYLSRGCLTLDCRTLRLDLSIQSFLLCLSFMPEVWILWAITEEFNLLVLPQSGSILCGLRAQAALYHIFLEVTRSGDDFNPTGWRIGPSSISHVYLQTLGTGLPWLASDRLKSAHMILDIPSHMSYYADWMFMISVCSLHSLSGYKKLKYSQKARYTHLQNSIFSI